MSDESIKMIFSIIGEIKEEHSGTNDSGIKKCPACGKKLYWAISSYNDHTRGKCETSGCLGWME